MRFRRVGDGGEFEVELITVEGATIRVRIGDRELTAGIEHLPDGNAVVTLDGRRWPMLAGRRGKQILVAAGPHSFEFAPAAERARSHAPGLAAPEVTAPMPGKVLQVLVEDGQAVAAGQPLVVLEAMKMETTLTAESAAIVKRVRVRVGQMVDHGAVLIELSSPPGSSVPQSEEPAS
jgi:3-methylcrotonyl-CoA carboxylase alpha subunit